MSSRLKHIRNWLEVAQEAKWSVKALAERCGVSPHTLDGHFLATVGKKPKPWLTEQRLELARQMIENGRTVKEAAHALKFKHASHLTNAFKKHWGRAPTKKMNLADWEC